MATFLIYYSHTSDAKLNNLPKVGIAVEINTIDDLDALSKRLSNNRLIIHPGGKDRDDGPYWITYAHLQDEDDIESEYRVNPLPADYK